ATAAASPTGTVGGVAGDSARAGASSGDAGMLASGTPRTQRKPTAASPATRSNQAAPREPVLDSAFGSSALLSVGLRERADSSLGGASSKAMAPAAAPIRRTLSGTAAVFVLSA